MKYYSPSFIFFMLTFTAVLHKTSSAQKKNVAASLLPRKGIAQYDFFYAGEAKAQNMYIVRKGQIVWEYKDAVAKGEISDAVLMTNGNILFAHQYGITLINKDKKILWQYEAPKGREVHTAQPVGKDHIVFVENGDPGRVHVVNIITGKTVKEFAIPVGNSKGVHGQFRHARLTAKRNIISSSHGYG